MSEDVPPQPGATDPVPKTLELSVMEAFGTPDEVIPYEKFEEVRTALGFKHFKQGTFRTEPTFGPGANRRMYAYAKKGAYFKSESSARKFIEVARTLTKSGVLLPETEWRLMRHPSGNFIAFAVTRELKAFDDPEGVEQWETRPKFKVDWLYERSGIQGGYSDAEADNPDSFVHYIEPGETQHSNNWGWSPEHKRHYPIDVEVIMFNNDPDLGTDNSDAVQIQFAWQDKQKQQPTSI